MALTDQASVQRFLTSEMPPRVTTQVSVCLHRDHFVFHLPLLSVPA